MASFIPNAPSNLDMEAFRHTLDRFGGPAKMCRFAVRILPYGTNQLSSKINSLRDLPMLCESAEFPGRGFEFNDYRYYGPSFQTPHNAKYQMQTDLTFICRNEGYERELFDDWLELINPSDSYDFNYPEDYYAQIEVFQFSEVAKGDNGGKGMTPVYQWTLLKAWPIQVNPQPVTWADQDILRLSVTFSYQKWFRPKDANPTT